MISNGNWVVRGGLVVAAIVLAAASALFALNSAVANRTPNIVGPSLRTNGFGLEHLADQSLTLAVYENQGQMPERLSAETVEAAREAFLKEPTASKAVRILALNEGLSNRPDVAVSMMKKATELTKRDGPANLWMAEYYGREGDIAKVIEQYDLTLRSSNAAAKYLIPLMTKSLSDEAAIDPYLAILKTQPPWALYFWQRLVRNKKALVNAAKLRMKLPDDHIPTARTFDRILLSQLISEGHMAVAREMYDHLVQEQPRGDEGVINNSDFNRLSTLPPFDWETLSTGTYSSNIRATSGDLQINAVAGASGVVARQLIELRPGQYRLTARSKYEIEPEKALLSVTVSCAQAGAFRRGALLQIAIDSRLVTKDFLLEDNACKFFWLQLELESDASRSTTDVAVDKISLVATSG